jgi:hypothetical protein
MRAWSISTCCFSRYLRRAWSEPCARPAFRLRRRPRPIRRPAEALDGNPSSDRATAGATTGPVVSLVVDLRRAQPRGLDFHAPALAEYLTVRKEQKRSDAI